MPRKTLERMTCTDEISKCRAAQILLSRTASCCFVGVGSRKEQPRIKKTILITFVLAAATTCDRLGKLTDAQWRDAFRAGGFEPSVAERFIARLKVKIEEGLKLAE